jgi:membrane protease YdiL (CAAX protease family)
MTTNELTLEREVTPEQLPLGKAIALHLFPGVGLVSVMYPLAPVMDAIRAPRFLAFLIAGIAVIGGWELTYLLRQARKRGERGLGSPVVYRQRIPKRSYAIVLVLIAWMLLVTIVWQSTGQDAARSLFSWLPSWTQDPIRADLSEFAPWTLVVTAILTFVLNGVFGPTVEELYFRGHLMPRIDRLRALAPLLNTVLFACYHLWTPWNAPSRIVGFFPIA